MKYYIGSRITKRDIFIIDKDMHMLETTSTLLMVIDVQGNLAEAMFDREMLYKNMGIIIEGCKILDVPILWLEQYPKGLGPTVPEVAKHLDGLTPHPKTVFPSLNDENILRAFNASGRTKVLLTGIETHICVYQTAMQLIDRGNEVQVVADAVSSRTEYNRQIGIEKITRAGGSITSVETALFEMLGSAESKFFREILNLVK